jgi:L-fuculose-phosphate aldolase
MTELGRRLYDRGLIGAREGNLSARIDPHRVLCTPATASKGHLSPSDLVVLDAKSRWVAGGPPTSEIAMHLAAYEDRDDVAGIVHAHPPVATGFSLAGETIPMGVMTEVDMLLGPVALVPYAAPGSPALPQGMKPYLQDHNCFLLAHHGAVTLGTDLFEAYDRMEALERCARSVITAKTLGRVNRIPATAPPELLEMEAAGGQ